jgi:addiction module RelE/StbE family toxin
VKVLWTTPAVEQLQGIFEFIAADNPEAEARTVRRIRNAVLQTARMPNIGRTGRVAGTREIVVPGSSYLVAYRLVDKMLHVLAVLHGAREWPESF